MVLVNLLDKFCVAIIPIGLINLIAFFIGVSYLGGDAVNGKFAQGTYYLSGNHNGLKQFFPVSRHVFEYSKWHVYSIFVTQPLMLVAGWIYEYRRRRNSV
jgi:hypothetical protein